MLLLLSDFNRTKAVGVGISLHTEFQLCMLPVSGPKVCGGWVHAEIYLVHAEVYLVHAEI